MPPLDWVGKSKVSKQPVVLKPFEGKLKKNKKVLDKWKCVMYNMCIRRSNTVSDTISKGDDAYESIVNLTAINYTTDEYVKNIKGKIMFKNTKRKIMLAVVAIMVVWSAISVAAATTVNSATYSAYVTKLSDYVTAPLYKTTTTEPATNCVCSIDNNISLCSWVNNYLSQRATNKVYYSSTGRYTMPYTVEISPGNENYWLSTTMTISTQITEFTSSNSSGRWSPDSIGCSCN